jgi:ornithine cyclodeaminase/alanine dehydrogenase
LIVTTVNLSQKTKAVIDAAWLKPGAFASVVDLSMVQGDLTGLVTGAVDGRITNDERIAFIFRGFALGDLALATLAFQAYRQ